MEYNKKQLLVELLYEWFNTTNFKDRNFLNQDVVAVLLKEKLTILGFWKKRGKWNVSENSLKNLNKGKPAKTNISNNKNTNGNNANIEKIEIKKPLDPSQIVIAKALEQKKYPNNKCKDCGQNTMTIWDEENNKLLCSDGNCWNSWA